MTNSNTEKYSFQAEVKQVLDIVVHSLYTDKDIFVRELISNASDALEKLRHITLSNPDVRDNQLELDIQVTTDEAAGTITIHDSGIGMTRQELVQNLGTIAHSGSKKFLEAIKQSGSSNENLIGQFGVGFYSVFMVAETVDVFTQSYQKDEQEAYHWSCNGSSEFTIEPTQGQSRGSKIIAKLKPEYKEFASESRIKAIIERYSAYVPFPILLNGTRINTIQALWLKSKSEIKDEDYEEFYKFQAHAFDKPLSWLHFNADAPLTINSILFIPSQNMEKMGFMRLQEGVALYCRKVLIDAEPKGLLPEWLRFVKGVVDSADLPLNISRESMQDSALIQKLRQVLTKRFIKHLEELSKKQPEVYAQFWENFHVFIKEGITSDPSNKEQLIPLLNYESSTTEPGKQTTLTDYISRMQPDQKTIYYVIGKNRSQVDNSPYLEAFRSRGLEVLFLFETIDEYVMTHIAKYQDKELTSIDQSSIELNDLPNENSEPKLSESEFKDLSTWMQSVIGAESATEIKEGKRLIKQPILALASDAMMSSSMRRIMKAMNQPMDETPSVVLELNTSHPIIKNLASLRLQNEPQAKKIALVLFNNALMAAGLLEDHQKLVQEIYSLLETTSS